MRLLTQFFILPFIDLQLHITSQLAIYGGFYVV